MNRLQERYENEVVKSLMEKFNYSSKMQAPKIEKIVLNIGVGDAAVSYTHLKKVLHYGHSYHIIPMLMSRRSARLLKHRKALS